MRRSTLAMMWRELRWRSLPAPEIGEKYISAFRPYVPWEEPDVYTVTARHENYYQVTLPNGISLTKERSEIVAFMVNVSGSY